LFMAIFPPVAATFFHEFLLFYSLSLSISFIKFSYFLWIDFYSASASSFADKMKLFSWSHLALFVS
jgi:hypothetical protein